MSTLGIAVIAAAAALACYTLGICMGRRTAADRRLPDDGVSVGRPRTSDRLLLDEWERANRYRLAWLSARRRAHRGQLLAHMLGDCDECGAPPLAPHTIDCHAPMPIWPCPDCNRTCCQGRA